MPVTKAYEQVLRLAMERPFVFIEYQPRDNPMCQSNIASLFGCSPNQTLKLLEAVDTLEGDLHFNVEREPVHDAISGSKGKEYPAKIMVTVSVA